MFPAIRLLHFKTYQLVIFKMVNTKKRNNGLKDIEKATFENGRKTS